MKYMETNSLNPYYNLSFEEYVLKNDKEDDYLMLWQNDHTVVIGAHQNTLEEVNLMEAEKFKVNIGRRTTGGGAVYHDLGNLNFSFITDWNHGENANYTRFLSPVVNALAEIGLHVEIKGRNDLLIEGKKISGSAQRLVKDRILHHGTLLMDSNLDMMGNLLNVSADKIQSKGIKSVKSRVTNVLEHASNKVSVEEMKNLLIRHWSLGREVEIKQPNQIELEEIEFMEKNKYRTWEWTFGRSPKFNFRNNKRFSGGSVEVNLEIQEGNIKECVINGDFLAMVSVSHIEKALTGEKYEMSIIENLIHSVPLKLYFGDITADELMSCFSM